MAVVGLTINKINIKDIITEKNIISDIRRKEYHQKNKITFPDNKYNLIHDEIDLLNIICPYCNKDYIKNNYKINKRRKKSQVNSIKINKDCATININNRFMQNKTIEELHEYIITSIINRKCINCKRFKRLLRFILIMIIDKQGYNKLVSIYGKKDIESTIEYYLEDMALLKDKNNKLIINEEYFIIEEKIKTVNSNKVKEIKERKIKEFEERLKIRKEFERKQKEKYMKQFNK